MSQKSERKKTLWENIESQTESYEREGYDKLQNYEKEFVELGHDLKNDQNQAKNKNRDMWDELGEKLDVDGQE